MPSIQDFPIEDWQRLADAERSPFMDHRFFRALEESLCVGGESGWYPFYISVDGPNGRGALPAFLKTHSYGEYIFDWSWADAAYRMGGSYYPKIVVASPFSPVGGRRFLSENQTPELWDDLASTLERLAVKMKVSSIHYLFCSEAEKRWLGQRGYIPRDTFQFQWLNEGYETFDDFLARFRSKRRHQIKRERRRVAEAGVELCTVEGDSITEDHMAHMFRLYKKTVDQYYGGQLYLNADFFQRILHAMRDRICLVQAKRGGTVIAQTFNLVSDGVFYGRYWGCEEDVEDLHFETCCYFPVQIAIERGWKRVELGAGGRHKWGRGFLPKITHSAHLIYDEVLNRAVAQAVAHESASLRSELAEIENNVFKPCKESE